MKSFTLIETLVTIAIFTLAMLVTVGFIVMAYRVRGYAWQQSRAIQEARKGIEIMVREIREAKEGDDGSYPIELASNKEFIFYSDIDKDGATERVRYFLGSAGSGFQSQECVTFADGGSCAVNFSDFLQGTPVSAQVEVSVEGDFGWAQEYAEIFADGVNLGEVCKTGCWDCPGDWQGTKTFDVTVQAADNTIQFTADATSQVNDFCDWQEPNHSMKAKFELTWTETLPGQEHEFKKGVINPTAPPLEYPEAAEEITTLSSYVRNAPPIFRYFDAQGEELFDTPTRLKDTKMMRVYLIVNVNPERRPQDFELESTVQLRNLKTNL